MLNQEKSSKSEQAVPSHLNKDAETWDGPSPPPEQLQQAGRAPKGNSTRGLLYQVFLLGTRGKGSGPGIELYALGWVFYL